jgi:hypothetical protein
MFDLGTAKARAVISMALVETSSFSLFTTMVSSCEGATAEDGVADRATSDVEARDDDAEGEDGGEAPADCPGESPSNKRGILRRRSAVLVLMHANVERLSGSNTALRCLLIKSRPE